MENQLSDCELLLDIVFFASRAIAVFGFVSYKF